MQNRLIVLAATAACGAGAANAGMMFAEVDQLGGEARMNAGVIDGVFGTSPTEFSNSALGAIHADISSDVDTSNRVSFALLQTDAGLAFATLVDQPALFSGDRGMEEFRLLMLTSAPIGSDAFTNDDGVDLGAPSVLGGREVVGGAFGWNDSTDLADGFAWAGLQAGDFVNASFTEGMDDFVSADAFQFLSYNADTESWEVVATGDFTNAGQFAYSAQIVPAPASVAALGGVGLIGLRRRRR